MRGKDGAGMIKMGIIGCGNMGGAMLRQMLKAGIFQGDEVLVSDKNPALLKRLADETGVRVTRDNMQAAAAPMVLLAVKPQYILDVTAEIADVLSNDTLVFSIVTGMDMKSLAEALRHPEARIIRIMPNTPALVGQGVLAACRSATVTEEQWAFAMQLLSCMGLAEEVHENMMDAITGLSGSSPAFVFLFLEALADAGVREGLPRAVARRLAAQTLLGSAKLAQETGLHPGELKDMVTSPGGTTIEGVAALEKDGLRFAVMDAVHVATEKARSFHKKTR